MTANRSTAATWPPVCTTMVITWPDAAWNGTVSHQGVPWPPAGRQQKPPTGPARAELADLGPQALIHASNLPADPYRRGGRAAIGRDIQGESGVVGADHLPRRVPA